MPSPTGFPTPGKIIEVRGDHVVFAPRGTTYELLLKPTTPFTGQTNTPVEAILRATARKVWTVPSGGNFISPIVGPPKIIQGRVKYLGDRELVVQAGATFLVALPAEESAIDLPNGAMAVGAMVNVTAFAGATIEIVEQKARSASPGVAHTGQGAGAAATTG